MSTKKESKEDGSKGKNKNKDKISSTLIFALGMLMIIGCTVKLYDTSIDILIFGIGMALGCLLMCRSFEL